MLTKEAFNALLKTLEEPPRCFIFISNNGSTQSATDHFVENSAFDFKRLSLTLISDHLKEYFAKRKYRV